jgi:hypothetical protein
VTHREAVSSLKAKEVTMDGSSSTRVPRSLGTALRGWGTGAGVLGIFLAFAALPAQGQVIQGSVHDQNTGDPVAAAFVVLLDEGGERVSAVLTDGNGWFTHRRLAPGTYVPRVERIGFRTENFDPVTLADGGVASLRMEVRSEAIALEAITVEGRSRCRIPQEEGAVVADLWEEVRKALEITVWTEQEPGIHVRARTYERALDLVTLEVVEERGRTGGGFTRNPFFSHDPEELARDGYVQEAPDGGHIYYGLSAEAILSRPFEDTHCFRVRQPRRGQPSNEIGLAFEPAPGRTVPGVSGVLWLDRETAELRRVEYEYTRHLHGVRLPEGRFGGGTEFRRLENGAWIIDRWTIRAPEFERVVSTDQLPRGTIVRGGIATETELRREFRRVGLRIREMGGTLVSVSLVGRHATGSATLEGTVYDSLAGGPLPGATIYTVDTGHEAETDADGRFSLSGLPAGEVAVGFDHPALDMLGHAPDPVLVRLGARDTVRLHLATPSPGTLLGGRCRPDEDPVLGLVSSADDGLPVAGVLVVAEWDERWRRDGDRAFARDRAHRGAMTDESGWYVLCGVAPGQNVQIRAEVDGEVAARSRIPVRRGEGGRVDFTLEPPSPDRPGRIVGRVLSAEADAPVAGASVRLGDGPPQRLSDEWGGFAFDSVPPGRVTIRVEHLGYGPAEGPVEVAPGGTVRLEVQLYDRPIELAEMVVTVRPRAVRVGRLADFRDRVERGIGGSFIHRDEIERRSPMLISDLLGSHGFDQQQGDSPSVFDRGLVSRRFACAPMVYLNGFPITHVAARASPEAIEEAGVKLNLINPADVEGIEIYRGAGTVPGEFGGTNARCGVIVVWTREG